MSDQPSPAPLDVRPVKRPLWRRLSLVWLVPILALGISLFAAWQSYLDQGTLIQITFENASGIKAGETEIKYRDVTVGKVEDVEFAAGLSVVLVHARVDKTVAPYLDDDAQFWVVRPDVSVRGITGLDTVLSGVYLEGNWDSSPDVAQFEFTGLEKPALTRAGQRGKVVVLRARDGNSVTAGAPILHKGIQVGYLETPELSFDGSEVLVNAFIETPYDRRMTSSTRFWDTSGFSVSLGAGGVSLDVNSLASLIEGGVAFDTIVSGGQPIADGHIFDIFDGRQQARESLFTDPNAQALEIAVLFEESVEGLSPGAEVRFQGITVGEVTEINAIVVGEGDTSVVRLQAVLSIQPTRLGMSGNTTPDAALDLLSDFVNRGLRARMVTGNILSGALVVELVEIEDALPAIVTLTSGQYPVIPTTTSEISDVAASAEDVLARINALPVEELLSGAIDLMDSLERLTNDEYTRAAPASLVALLDEARELVASEDVQGVPTDLRDVIAGLNLIIAGANDAGIVADLNDALESTNAAAANIATATEDLPALLGEIEALAAKANALALDRMVNSASDALASINSLTSSDVAQSLPGSLTNALSEMETLLADIRTSGTVENTNTAIQSANAAALALEQSVSTLPDLIAQIEAVAAKANALELDGLIDAATATLGSFDRLIGTQDAAALPGSLNGALDETRQFLAEVRAGGAIESVNAALASANEAAQAIEQSVSGLPALSQRANQLVSELRTVVDTYSDRSRFNAETLQTLRDIQEAADSVSALARTIQRNPNSVLTGRR